MAAMTSCKNWLYNSSYALIEKKKIKRLDRATYFLHSPKFECFNNTAAMLTSYRESNSLGSCHSISCNRSYVDCTFSFQLHCHKLRSGSEGKSLSISNIRKFYRVVRHTFPQIFPLRYRKTKMLSSSQKKARLCLFPNRAREACVRSRSMILFACES